MLPISEFIALKEGKINRYLDPNRREYFVKSHLSKWEYYLNKHLPYKDSLIHGMLSEEETADIPKDRDVLYVYCAFTNPGQHNYLVFKNRN